MPNLIPFLVSGLGIGAVYALSGVGLVVLYRATGVLNLAFGALGALAAYVAWATIEAGWPPPAGWLAGIAAAVLGSWGYGWLISPRLSQRDPVVRAVGTLAFALMILGTIGWMWGEIPRRLQLPTDKLYLDLLSTRLTYTRLLALGLAVATVSMVGLLLSQTRLGLGMRALADSPDLSAILGINVVSVEAWAWLIAGVFAGLSGILLADLVRLQATQLTFLVIPAISVALLGGLSSLSSTAAAGIAVGVAEALLTAAGPLAPYRAAAPYVIALGAVAVLSRMRGSGGGLRSRA